VEDKKFCKGCGEVISPHHKFCGNCGAMLSGGLRPIILEESSASVDADFSKMNRLEQSQDARKQHLEGGNITQKSSDSGQLLCINCGSALTEKAWLCMRCGRPVYDEKAIKRWVKRQEKLGISPQPPFVPRYYAQTHQQTPSTDIPEKIRKLAQLKEEGILTEEEFQTQKQKLLLKM